tara:strand:- start:15752 stop:16090 length:339 start_codon:yes stop_codon:yes gene_type:complete
MTTQILNYDQAVSGDTKVTHTTITIAAGENVEKFAPLVHDATSGHFKAAAADATKADYLSAFAVDATTGAKAHSAIKSITIDPAFVAYPETMTDAKKSGLFAGTPISTQSPA